MSNSPFAEIVGDRSIFVHGSTVRAFEKGTLVAVIVASDALRQRIWVESMASSYVAAHRVDLWWVSDCGGWDFLLNVAPEQELRKFALGVTCWSWRNGKVVCEDKTHGLSEEPARGDS